MKARSIGVRFGAFWRWRVGCDVGGTRATLVAKPCECGIGDFAAGPAFAPLLTYAQSGCEKKRRAEMDAIQGLLGHVDAYLKGESTVEQCVALLAPSADAPDVLWLCGLQHDKDSAEWKPLCELVARIAEESPTHAIDLMLALELDLLSDAGVVDAQQAKTRTVRVNTALKYRQVKYNLLHESNEGFARVLCELNAEAPSASSLLGMVGMFRIDPNRLVDLVLDRLSLVATDEKAADGILQLFSALCLREENIGQVLGFKLENSTEFYGVAALLIARRVVALEAVCAHLQPPLASFAAVATTYDDYLLECVPTVGKINLATGQPVPAPEEPRVVDQVSPLLAALLRLRDGEQHGRHLMDVLRAHGALPHQLQRHVEVRRAMLVVLNRLLDVHGDSIGEGSEAFTWLAQVGSALSEDPRALARVVRVLARMSSSSSSDDQKQQQQQVLRVLDVCVLPAIAMLPRSNPAIVIEMWQTVLAKFAYSERFALYKRQLAAAPSPVLALRRAHMEYQTRHAVKVVAKEKTAQRVAGIKLARQVHVDPVCALPVLLRNIQTYDNTIPAAVDMFKHVAPWGLDVLAYLIVHFLSDETRAKVKDDGTNASAWLSTLCRFAGQFYFKFPQVELRGLLYLVGRRLSGGDSAYLLALEQVVAKMSGFLVLEDIADDVLQCAAGVRFLFAAWPAPGARWD